MKDFNPVPYKYFAASFCLGYDTVSYNIITCFLIVYLILEIAIAVMFYRKSKEKERKLCIYDDDSASREDTTFSKFSKHILILVRLQLILIMISHIFVLAELLTFDKYL